METIAQGWRKAIEEYSRLELTKLPEDRLVTLSQVLRVNTDVPSRPGSGGTERQKERRAISIHCATRSLGVSWFPEFDRADGYTPGNVHSNDGRFAVLRVLDG